MDSDGLVPEICRGDRVTAWAITDVVDWSAGLQWSLALEAGGSRVDLVVD